MHRLFFVISFLFVILFTGSAFSQDRNFARTYQSITLPKGVKDLEVWNTFRSGRDDFYRRIDQRIEFEVGLTDKLQTALYINASHISALTYMDLGSSVEPAPVIESESEFSFSSEWKWRLSSADANALGFALYGEATFAPRETELEGKIILDKRTEKNILALNLVGEMEWKAELENGTVDTEEETIFETDLAYMHMFKNNFGLGIELRNHNVFAESEEHSALFGGPTLFFSGNKYFLILNVLPQLANLKKTDDVPGSLDLNEYEKVEVRLLLGFGL
jgi:hypothetical protein